MHIIIPFSIFSVITKIGLAETSKEPPVDLPQQITLKSPLKDMSIPDSHYANPHLNSLWVYHPASHLSQLGDDYGTHQVILKAPYSLTKLAKTLSFGVDPYFSKGYFEPFERRPRPVTLVALRKHGLLPRKTLQIAATSDVAELQSPYNDVSNFWQNEPGES